MTKKQTNNEERTLFAQRQLIKKLQHEERIKKDLAAYFDSLELFAAEYIFQEFSSPDFLFFNADLRKILFEHYNIVYDDFRFDFGVGEEFSPSGPELAVLNQNKDEFIGPTSAEHSLFITRTNNKEITKSFLDSVLALSSVLELSGTELNLNNSNQRRFVADNSASIFRERANARIDTIALTETQQPAERSKMDTALAFDFVTPEEEVSEQLASKKEWNAILDNRVRAAHALADGQIQDISAPFIVNGEKLNIPGDTSMGASASNTINCRCSARYFAD